MNDVPPIAARLVDYLDQRLNSGDDGKTLLIGLLGQRARFAVAAGLRGESDHPRFLAFGRYLIHDRFGCDGFALMRPALVDGRAAYVTEWRHAGVASMEIICDGARMASDLSPNSLGDLGRRGPARPGLMRRQLDELYEVLRLPLPDIAV